jgi:hypothetical protein
MLRDDDARNEADTTLSHSGMSCLTASWLKLTFPWRDITFARTTNGFHSDDGFREAAVEADFWGEGSAPPASTLTNGVRGHRV